MIWVVSYFSIEDIYPTEENIGPTDVVIAQIDQRVARELVKSPVTGEVRSGLPSLELVKKFSFELEIKLERSTAVPILTPSTPFLLGRRMGGRRGKVLWYTITRS